MAKRQHRVFEDGVLVREFPFTFREDLLADIEEKWKASSMAAFPNGLPQDIDEYRANFDPGASFVQAMRDAGLTEAQINALPPPFRVALTVFIQKALEAIWYNHQKIPGVPEDVMNS